LVQLREQYRELRRAGAEVLAVSVDTPEESAALKERLAVPLPILSDPGHCVIDRYGVFHEDEPRGHSIARPSLFVIDGAGQIRYTYVGLRPSDRPDTATLLHLLSAAAQA
jgi:peroxiredoxin Q/BCP